MKYCKFCNIKYDSDQTKCVFCSNELENVDNKPANACYPAFKGFYPKREKVLRLLAFSLLCAFAVSILLNIYLFKDRMYWLFTLLSSLYVFFAFKSITNPRRQVTAKILICVLLSIVEIYIVFDFFSLNLETVFFEFIYPGILIGSLITQFVFLMVFKKRKIYDNMIYCLLSILFGLTPIIITLISPEIESYVCAFCVGLSLLFLIWLVIFERDYLKGEIIRRFHI